MGGAPPRQRAAAVGYHDHYLLAHRTEPLEVDLYVESILDEYGVRAAYDRAVDVLSARYDSLNGADTTAEEQAREATEIDQLWDRLESQRVADWTSYGQALTAAVYQAADELLPELPVPVTVTVDLENQRAPTHADFFGDGILESLSPAAWLREVAIERTARPGGGRAPLDRLDDPHRPPR